MAARHVEVRLAAYTALCNTIKSKIIRRREIRRAVRVAYRYACQNPYQRGLILSWSGILNSFFVRQKSREQLCNS